MTEKETQSKMPRKKVMVAIDESECSYFALMWALDNLKELIMANSPLVIFASYSAPYYISTGSPQLGFLRMSSPLSPNFYLNSSILERNKEVSLGILEKAQIICASRGVESETIMECGEPRELICNAVLKNEIDLLVIGDEASGSIKRAFMGSLSSYCLNNTKCHVLAVTKPE